MTTVHTASTIHAFAGQASPPTDVPPACTSQYDGSSSTTECSHPCWASGPQAPPSRANSAVIPPIAGPMESTVSRWPMTMPMTAKGTRATST
jgi:hypothetical protein